MDFLIDGLKLMAVGMGMVFAFLVIMYFWVGISAKLSHKFAHLLPEDEKTAPRRAPKKPAPQAAVPPVGAVDQSALAAVIGSAVQAYRRDRGMI